MRTPGSHRPSRVTEGRAGRGWVGPILLLTVPVTIVAAGFHLLATADKCGLLDGGPDAGEEAFCDGDLLYVPTAVGAVVVLVGAALTARFRSLVPLLVAFVFSAGWWLAVPFAVVKPVCHDVAAAPPQAASQFFESGSAFRGATEEDVCRAIGGPNEVDNGAWVYFLPPAEPQETPGVTTGTGRRLRVEFEAGRVAATRREPITPP